MGCSASRASNNQATDIDGVATARSAKSPVFNLLRRNTSDIDERMKAMDGSSKKKSSAESVEVLVSSWSETEKEIVEADLRSMTAYRHFMNTRMEMMSAFVKRAADDLATMNLQR